MKNKIAKTDKQLESFIRDLWVFNYFVAAADLNSMQKMQDELKEDMAKLQTIDRLKTEFLSMVSHELRTPITPIRGYISLLSHGKLGELNEKQKEAVAVICRQSEHLQDLIESLLDISRFELGKPIPTNMEIINLAEPIKQVVQAAKVNFDHHNFKLKLEIKKNLPEICADRIKIKRVLTNLIGNALKFGKDNDEIKIKASKDKENIRLEVVDHGTGIAKNKLEKIFEKFFQVDSSATRTVPGIGMGLAIAKELVELHSGKIWAESKGLGKGAKFIFTLPIKQ